MSSRLPTPWIYLAKVFLRTISGNVGGRVAEPKQFWNKSGTVGSSWIARTFHLFKLLSGKLHLHLHFNNLRNSFPRCSIFGSDFLGVMIDS